MTRQEANILLLGIISHQIYEAPDLRFNQILVNIGITDVTEVYLSLHNCTVSVDDSIDYNEESEATLKRILDNLPT